MFVGQWPPLKVAKGLLPESPLCVHAIEGQVQCHLVVLHGCFSGDT